MKIKYYCEELIEKGDDEKIVVQLGTREWKMDNVSLRGMDCKCESRLL